MGTVRAALCPEEGRSRSVVRGRGAEESPSWGGMKRPPWKIPLEGIFVSIGTVGGGRKRFKRRGGEGPRGGWWTRKEWQGNHLDVFSECFCKCDVTIDAIGRVPTNVKFRRLSSLSKEYYLNVCSLGIAQPSNPLLFVPPRHFTVGNHFRSR